MTWKELLEIINEMDERFLASKVEVYDCSTGETFIDISIMKDCSADYVYDVEQPQLWVNYKDQ